MKNKLIILTLCLVSTLLGDVSDINNTVNKDVKNNSSNSNYYSSEERSGYTSHTSVTGKEELFVQEKFEPNDFISWLQIYYAAKSIETFITFEKEGKIDRRGVLTVSYKDIPAGKIIEPKLFYDEKRDHLTPTDFFKFLQSYNILDENGYAKHITARADKLEDVDFSQLERKVMSVDLSFDNKVLEENMKRDLYRLIKTAHQVNKITTVTTTDYQSRENGLLNNVVDQMAGSFLGNIFFKNKEQTSTHRAGWSPSFYPSNYLDNYYVTFNDYPFQYGAKSIWGWNGRTSINELSYTYLDDTTSVSTLEYRHKVTSLKKGGLTLGNSGYGGVYASSIFLSDNSGKLNLHTLGLGIGVGSSFILEPQFGLTLKDTLSDNAIGLNLGINTKWYLLKFLSLHANFNSYFQPESNGTNWQLEEQKYGLSLHQKQFSIEGGYQRLSSDFDTTLVDGSYFGVRYLF